MAKSHYSALLARRKQASSLDGSINGTLIDALESGRINTKIRIACLEGAHADGPLLAQSRRSLYRSGWSKLQILKH